MFQSRKLILNVLLALSVLTFVAARTSGSAPLTREVGNEGKRGFLYYELQEFMRKHGKHGIKYRRKRAEEFKGYGTQI